VLDGQTTVDIVPGGQTTPSGGQTTRAQEGHSAVVDPTNCTSTADRQPGSQTASSCLPTVRPLALVSPTAISCKIGTSSGANGTTSPTAMEEDIDDDLLDYEPSPARDGIDVNVIYLSSTDYSLLEEEEVLQLTLGPQDAVFKKPTESKDHLKPLYIHGHLDGTSVDRMLVDGGSAVNVMSYSTFKKLGKTDAELIKMNMMIMGIRRDGPIGPKGVASMELTVGSKTIPTTFFIAEVQGNYNTILGRDGIHANHCVPSTLHQFLIQWVSEEVEIVCADVSACIATADSSSWTHDNIKCLSGQDISYCNFVSVSKDGFIPIFIKPVDDRLNLIM
jgi:hypothetical protein